MGDLPWAFRGDDHEAPFISEGSASDRAPEIFVFLSDEDAEKNDPNHPTTEDIYVLDRNLRRITEQTTIVTRDGQCIIRPSAGQRTEEEDYHLSGMRLYSLESDWPLFLGVPQLRISKPETFRAVPAREVSWRQQGYDWQPYPTGFGLWQVRHVQSGELRYLSRLGLLPDQFNLRLTPGTDMTKGHMELSGADGAMVEGHAEDTELTTQGMGDTLQVHVRARDAAAVPARIALRLHWQNAAELTVYAPFPGRGGRFLHDGKPVDGEIAVDDLYGVRATALSAANLERFWIEGELKAPDLPNDVLRVAYFRVPLGKSGLTYERSLIHLRSTIELLFGASSSSSTRVRVRIVDGLQHEHDVLQVRRFSGTINYDTASETFVARQTVGVEPPTIYEALPIARPDTDPVPLQLVDPSNVSNGATFPPDMNIEEPWLVVARHTDRVRIRPIVFPGTLTRQVAGDGKLLCLHDAIRLREPQSRFHAIAAAMDAMLAAEDTIQSTDDWSFLTDTLLRAEGLPATSFDLLKVLATKSELLVRCMFRLESTPRQLLWRLDDDLPFSWLMIRRDIWLAEYRLAYDRLRDQLAGVMDADKIARNQIISILKEGNRWFPALYTVNCDIGFQMQGHRVPETVVAAAIEKRDDKTQEQLTLRYSMNDWPKGDGRLQWRYELERGELLDDLTIWQQDGRSPRERQPIFDTPVAAAWCCFASEPTDRTTFLVRSVRAHDPEWFDVAYEAAWFQLALMQDEGQI